MLTLALFAFSASIAIETEVTLTTACPSLPLLSVGDTVRLRGYASGSGDLYEGTGIVDWPGGTVMAGLHVAPAFGEYTMPTFPNGSLIDYFGWTADGYAVFKLVQPVDGGKPIVCDHTFMPPVVTELLPGDANRDGLFNSTDMILALSAGKYETGDVAGWSDGDWNADARFDSRDLVVALATGSYEQPTVAAVPEPSGWLLFGFAAFGVLRWSWRG